MGFLVVVYIITLGAITVFSAPKRDSALCIIVRSNTVCAEPKENIARQLDTQPQEKRNDVVIGYVYYDYAENQKGKPLNRYRSQQPRKELYEPGISYQYYDSDMSITRTENLVDDTNKTHEDKKKQNGGKRKNPLFSPFGYGRIKN